MVMKVVSKAMYS